MEMRGAEDVATGQDLTPPVDPLAFVLHDSTLGSRCSACFSPLPQHTFSPVTLSSSQNCRHVVNKIPALLYCSPHCSSLDSYLHFSAAEPHLLDLFRQSPPSTWDDSADLRLSLRLLDILERLPQEHVVFANLRGSAAGDPACFIAGENDYSLQEIEGMKSSFRKYGVLERIAGLMTNREGLMSKGSKNDQFHGLDEGCEDPQENTETLIEKIKEGAKLLATARRMRIDGFADSETDEEFLLEEAVFCLVLSNAVEVQDHSGCSIGVAVYGTSFSWINHSCSPNACYRFSLGNGQDMQQPCLRISPAAKERGSGKGFLVESDLPFPIPEGSSYGPRVIVRSIKDVRKGEEVTIAYTDLLQPKEMRRAELWLKYRFSCNCQRCSAVPTTYVDYALQVPSTSSIDCPESSDNKLEKVLESIDDAIAEYLSTDDPKSCCEKLENLLSHGYLLDEPIESKEAISQLKLKLNPFNYLSQNAYTTLASAYKVLAIDTLALSSTSDGQKLEEAFNMFKKSAAYSLLLAGVVHHLFTFEPALLIPVANFFTNAGESLSSLGRSSLWDSLLKLTPIHQESSPSLNCNRCGLSFKPNSALPDQNLPLEEVKRRVFCCIAEITPQVWSSVAHESSFLKSIPNPVDLSWLTCPVSNTAPIYESYFGKSEFRVHLVILGLHCLRYGSLFSSICYGPIGTKD